MVPMSYLENCIHVQILVGVDRLACFGVDRQIRSRSSALAIRSGGKFPADVIKLRVGEQRADCNNTVTMAWRNADPAGPTAVTLIIESPEIDDDLPSRCFQ
jgi:hypothetical protein